MNGISDKLHRAPRAGLLLTVYAILLCMGAAPRALAQPGVSALPSLYLVPWLEDPSRRLRLSASTGYGWLEDVLGAGDVHHRLLASVGAGLTSRTGIALEARLDARYDVHVLPGDDDSGAVLDPRFVARYTRPLSERISLGAQAQAWLPGGTFPQPAPRATSVDVCGLLGISASERVDVSSVLGYRIDNSAKAVSQPERLSPADFSALGLSSSDAVLTGVGVRTAYGRGSVFVELMADWLVGKLAPRVVHSPMSATLGVDHPLGEHGTRGRFSLSTSLSGRPDIDSEGPLVPLLPRLWMVLAVTQDTWVAKQPAPAPAPQPVAPPLPAPQPVAPQPSEPPLPQPAPEPVVEQPVQPRGVLRVFVRDADRGEPLDAAVTVVALGDAKPIASGRTEAKQGAIELEVAPGRYEARIVANGYAAQRRTVTVDEDGVTVLNADLRPREKP